MSSFARRLRRLKSAPARPPKGREPVGPGPAAQLPNAAEPVKPPPAQLPNAAEPPAFPHAAEPAAQLPSAAEPVGPAAQLPSATTPVAFEASAGATPADSGGGSPRVLQELREKMALILQRPVTPPAPSEVRGLWTLESFERLEEPRCYWSRRQRVRRTQRVGRSDCELAAEADPALLALLAFDAAIAGVDFRRALFLDTETTGLGAGAGTYAFLVGVCYFEGERLWLEQLLLEGPEQESALLGRLAELVARSEVLVTFNGKSFDWPLLESRFVMNHMDPPARLPHLDLLHLGRRIHKHRLHQCRLKHLEVEVLGFERSGDIEGAEVALRYNHYLRSGDARGLVAVVEHNYWDVLSMAALVGVYGQPEPELCAGDWLGLAHTYHRAKDPARAVAAAERAAQLGEGERAAYVRALVHKTLGERVQALAALEQAEDCAPVRLELAKLYEHFLKRPERALAIAEQGTGESASASARRLARLQAKVARRRQ